MMGLPAREGEDVRLLLAVVSLAWSDNKMIVKLARGVSAVSGGGELEVRAFLWLLGFLEMVAGMIVVW